MAKKSYWSSPGFGVAVGGMAVALFWAWTLRDTSPQAPAPSGSGGMLTGARMFGALSAGAFQGQVGSMVSLGAVRPQLLMPAPPVPAGAPAWGNSLARFVIDAPAQIRNGSMVTVPLGRGRTLSYRRTR